MRRLLWVIAAAILASACSYGAGYESFDDDLDQNIRQPLIRGTAYDAANERVFFAACRPEEFACDLLVVAANQSGPAQVFRASREYGYTWPAASPDGAHLAVVRTPRRWRANSAEAQQELVEIDLASGEERVVAASEGARFDRVLYVPRGIMVVRTIRSSPSVPCHAYFCGDWGDLVIFHDGTRERLPINATSDSGIVGGGISLTPLQDGRMFLDVTQRAPVGATNASRHAWVMNADGSLRGPATTRDEYAALVSGIPLGDFSADELSGGRVGRIERGPFTHIAPYPLALTQTNLVGPTRGAFVRKVRNGSGFILHVEAIERGSDGAWRSAWAVDTTFPR